MPIVDRKGQALEPGDSVNLPCVVRGVASDSPDYAHVHLEVVEPMADGYHQVYSAHAAQVEKVDQPHASVAQLAGSVAQAASAAPVQAPAPTPDESKPAQPAEPAATPAPVPAS